MKEVKLSSGAILKVGLSPFAVSKALYQAVLKEMKSVEVKTKDDVAGMLKDFACIGFSSPEIEKCLAECFKRCTYNELKIDDETFEAPERREDYVQVCVGVAQENIAPFMKSLFAQCQQLLVVIDATQK